MIPRERCTHLTNLLLYRSSRLFLPLVCLFEKCSPPHLLAIFPFFGKLLLDYYLCWDTSVISTRDPKRLIADHTMIPCEYVLNRTHKRMSKMKNSGYIRWWEWYGVGFPGFPRLRSKASICLPISINTWFKIFWRVLFRKIHTRKKDMMKRLYEKRRIWEEESKLNDEYLII